jgi:hypothetical protein
MACAASNGHIGGIGTGGNPWVVRLAYCTGKDTLAEMNPFAIAGRYPDSLFPLPSSEGVRGYVDRAREVFACLMRLL